MSILSDNVFDQRDTVGSDVRPQLIQSYNVNHADMGLFYAKNMG